MQAMQSSGGEPVHHDAHLVSATRTKNMRYSWVRRNYCGATYSMANPAQLPDG